jgi:hypothetical protein
VTPLTTFTFSIQIHEEISVLFCICYIYDPLTIFHGLWLNGSYMIGIGIGTCDWDCKSLRINNIGLKLEVAFEK